MALSREHRNAISRASKDLEAELISFTQQLIACRTDSQSEENAEFEPEARKCQDLISGKLESIGMEIERWDEPPRYPVVAGKKSGAGAGRSLAINGHVDVVPVGDRRAWQFDPWEGVVSEGRLWGRGSCDMKGGVAAAVLAVEALDRASVTLDGDLWLHIVADEEVVGVSTRHIAERLPRVDAVINAEPTGLRLMPVEGGLVHLRIEVTGRESHAGNRYKSVHAGGSGEDAGINAIEKTLKIVTALQDLERDWAVYRRHPMLPPGFNTILPGVIAGGPGGGRDGHLNLVSNPGTTPNYCSVEYNIWYLPDETFEQIRDEIEEFVRGVCQLDPWLKEHPPSFTWKLRNIWFPPVNTDPEHPFIQLMAETLRENGIEPVIEGFTAASELAWYADQGMRGTIFGPGSIAQAHGVDEFVEIEELVNASAIMALAIAEWCGITS